MAQTTLDNNWSDKDRPYRDEEVLRELYCKRKLSTTQIAGKLDCSPSTVQTWMGKHGIPTRSISQGKFIRRGTLYKAPYRTTTKGREVWEAGGTKIMVHRLVAVAEWGLESIRGKDVHHKNGIPWDNRPSNLEPLDRGDHRAIHSSKLSRLDRLTIIEMYKHPETTTRGLGELFDVNNVTICETVNKGQIRAAVDPSAPDYSSPS